MVDFCPECGNMLRKGSCKCGYDDDALHSKKSSNVLVRQVWDPPSPNIVYCRITGTSLDKLKKGLSKGNYPEKLKEIKIKLKKHEYSCRNCVYYVEKEMHCKIKNKYFKNESICTRFEPFDI